MASLDIAQWSSDNLVLLGRLIIAFAWTWAAASTWIRRHTLPQANQLLFGSLAMVGSQVAPLIYPNMEYPTYLFFVAAAQVTLVSALVKITQSRNLPSLIAQHVPARLFFFAVALSSLQASLMRIW